MNYTAITGMKYWCVEGISHQQYDAERCDIIIIFIIKNVLI